MIRGLIANAFYAGAAWQQASLCADAARHGLFVGLLMLFFVTLANLIVASWWRGHP
jgi:hypothetical protein